MTMAEHRPGSLVTVRLLERATNNGEILSNTVIVWTQLVVFADGSVAVQVRMIVPVESQLVRPLRLSS